MASRWKACREEITQVSVVTTNNQYGRNLLWMMFNGNDTVRLIPLLAGESLSGQSTGQSPPTNGKRGYIIKVSFDGISWWGPSQPPAHYNETITINAPQPPTAM